MFTWICPQCGREVPPAYDECPSCSGQTAAAEGVAPAQNEEQRAETVPSEPQPVPVVRTEPAGRPPMPPVPARPTVAESPGGARRSRSTVGVHTGLLAILFAFAFLGLGVGIYWVVGHLKGPSQAAATPSAVESPAAKPGTATSPFQKYIEISGIRFLADPKSKDKTLIRFTLTNHSEADFSDLAGNVTLWGRTQKSEEDAQGTFTFTTSIGPLESKDVTTPLSTKLKVYELPDWQNATPDLQITRPGPVSSSSDGPR